MTDAREVAGKLDSHVRRAVLMCPFNSRGSGIPGGALAHWNAGNHHMSGNPALFIRKQRADYSGDYTLTPFGLEVQREVRILMEQDKAGDA